MLEHRGVAPASVLYPLAHLGLGRAAALAGDADEARRQYETLLTLWNAADMGLPPLTAARTEHGRLVATKPAGGATIPSSN